MQPENLSPHEKLERRVRMLERHVANLPTKEDILTKDDIATIVRDTMKEVLLGAGRGTKATIITLATVIGALVIIGGGLKWLLAIIGFHKI